MYSVSTVHSTRSERMMSQNAPSCFCCHGVDTGFQFTTGCRMSTDELSPLPCNCVSLFSVSAGVNVSPISAAWSRTIRPWGKQNIVPGIVANVQLTDQKGRPDSINSQGPAIALGSVRCTVGLSIGSIGIVRFHHIKLVHVHRPKLVDDVHCTSASKTGHRPPELAGTVLQRIQPDHLERANVMASERNWP
jgi:hypothetical protein